LQKNRGWLEPFTETDAMLNRTPRLGWIICGGESGAKARPCHPDWVRSLRDQCVNANVPYFLKQLNINGKLIHMPELDGKIWEQMQKRGGNET